MSLAARALKTGDRVALVAPGHRPESPAALSYALKVIEEMGFVPVPGKHVLSCHGHCAGSDEERLSDLNGFIQDESIAGIFCLSGGFGVLPLLGGLDFQTLGRSRKLLVGSDENTALLLAVRKSCLLRTVLAPNLDRVRSKVSFDSLLAAVTSPRPAALGCEHENLGERRISKAYSSCCQDAAGEILGGNLSAVVSLMGTPFEPDFQDAILYLDDYNERFDILDRWFSSLYVSGHLAKTAAAVFGQFSACGSRGNTNILSLEDLFGERLQQLHKPNLFGLALGHNNHSLSLAIGVEARLDSRSSLLELAAAAVE